MFAAINIGGVLLGFLNVLLTCAIVVFIAFCILWALKIFGIGPDPDVLKWGKVIVGLICFIVIIGWLLSLLGVGGWQSPVLFR